MEVLLDPDVGSGAATAEGQAEVEPAFAPQRRLLATVFMA